MFLRKRKYTDNSDEQLVELLIAGDNKAFNELYNRYSQRLMYYFYRMLGNSNEKAQDFLQDIFMKLIDKAESFDPSKKFSTWIFSIAHNLCKNEYRRMDIRKNSAIEAYADILPEEEEDTQDWQHINMESFTKDLFEELENFDEIHKTAFLLRYREGFTVKDISLTLDISEGTVKSRLFYTRKRLSDRLSRYQTSFIL